MTTQEFLHELEKRVAKYDLLCHPFYRAWAAGELTKDDLQRYGCDYYDHVNAFPTYLAEFGIRLEDGDLRRAVLANMSDEKGTEDLYGDPAAPHAELWLDFVEGMGGSRNMRARRPLAKVKELVNSFHDVAQTGTAEEALAAFYAYESQVPRVAAEKARGLREMYGADEKTCAYFTLHETADIYHSQVWLEQLLKRVKANPQAAEKALNAAETAAKSLWRALDAIEARRVKQAA
jgi:pyrroloquinoline-quinone synthase